MRQRYYNPEIKRFVNQDVLTGNISNSQSLNRYSYVQGNPVSYTDPFGLSPLSGMFEGTALAHGILGVLGCIPGIGGAVFNAIDAWVYYYYDKDYFMATMSGISALSLGFGSIGKWAGKAASTAAKGSKAGRAFQYLSLSGNFLSNGLEFVQNGIQADMIGRAMWDKYVIGDAELGWDTVGETAGFVLSLMGCSASGRNMSQSGKQFGKMLKEDNVSGRIKQGFQKLAGDNHGWSPAGGDALAKVTGVKTNYAQSRGNTFNSSYNIPTDSNGYTKSNFKLGQDVHKEYKQNEVDDLVKFKEYRLPSKKRIDFIDFETKTIYELKPYNPNQIKKGNKQLEGYLREVESLFGAGWTTVLDTY